MSRVTPQSDLPPVSLPVQRTCPFHPPPELGELREQAPLRRLLYDGGQVGWLVTSHGLARAVLLDDRFSVRSGLQQMQVHFPLQVWLADNPPVGSMLAMDAPEHTRYRRLLANRYTVSRASALRPRIEEIVEGQLDVLEQAAQPADLVELFALPIPSLVSCELLGIPLEMSPDIVRNASVSLSLTSSVDEAGAAVRDTRALFRQFVADKRRHLTDDIASYLISSGELQDDELAGLIAFLHIAGFEAPANALALGAFKLLCDPDLMNRMRADPSLLGNAVDEFLRYLTPHQFGITRTALEDVELDGQLIKAGECVTVSLPAANRDPRKFDNPDELDLTRKAVQQLAFGQGVHMCLGQHVSRVMLQAAWPGLLRRFPRLRLAVPMEDLHLRSDMLIYGVHQLPVEW